MTQGTLVVGTRNRKKLAELVDFLQIPELRLFTAADFPESQDVVEDGATFIANAEKKAVQLAGETNRWTLGEDSGLCVDLLDGAPGIFSARYAGEPCDDAANNRKLLERLAAVPAERRAAYYISTIAVADPSGVVRIAVEGRCHGTIAESERGSNGFGYDPLFVLVGGDRTFGELPPDVKKVHSHRAAAVRELRPRLLALLQSGEWQASRAG